jgi:ATP-binding cassette, subfamily F, member 3
MMLRLEHISKVFPNGEPLRDVSWELKAGERLGLVGANGTGKTTLFKIITGEVEASSGEVVKQSGIRIACLSQEFDIVPENTVHEELLRAFAEVHSLKTRIHRLHLELESVDESESKRLLRKLDVCQREFEARDGYGIELKVDKILPEIGFTPADVDRLVSEFSCGWQMRIGLGKVMLQHPQIMLLDEPTNHIDLETIAWLEAYLRSLTTPMVIVSHDRFFLDRICTGIIELERGVSTTYPGNYSAYAAARQIQRESQEAAYERQQKEIERQMGFIDRFRASATRSTQAKSREHQLEKMELVEAPESEERTLKFRFPDCVRSGREVVKISDLTHAYGDNIVFLGANLLVERGDRIALLGPNGAGKSTLLRLIAGHEEPGDGCVRLGEHNIVPAYFEQNQAEALELEKTVLETIGEQVTGWKDVEIRGLAGRFLFSEDTVFKRVRDLSGGEKARLALAKMMTARANFLILDEPTNHLDIPAREMIEEALNDYEGTVIVVSHDRQFIANIANRIVEIKDGILKNYPGTYQYYLELLEEERLRLEEERQERERQVRQAERRAKAREKEKARKLKKQSDKADKKDK